jgi:nucleotide-binding universal stress UspA family protein
MISTVLVPMEDSEMSERALEHALAAYPDAEITVLHVVGEPSPMMGQAMSLVLEDGLEDAAEAHAEDVFERANEIAAAHDAEVSTRFALGSAAKAIVNAAEDFDVVVIGSHAGTLAERLVVGNVAEKVFRRSPAPVTVVR